MTIKVYNTLTRQKEEFVPITPGKANIYVCGVTPYNHPHVGNARPFVTWDVIRRFLEHEGYDVTHVQNFTDVDDKIINTANKEGVQWFDICNRYIDSYFEVMDKLNVRRAHVYPRVSEHIDDIIETVQTLIDNGYAYVVDGDVFYSVEKFKYYGQLSGRNLEDMMAGARVDVDERKHNPMDFALWKSAKPGEPSWASPWGNGRPGWHIECSTMSMKYLGKTFDFHGGGSDLIFPHHENEIAQSEAATGKNFANYWMHNGHINIDNKKMSKSAGNFFLTRDAAEKYGYETIRYLMIQAHYRMPMNYTAELLDSCKASLERLYNCRENLDKAIEKAVNGSITAEAEEIFEKRKSQFITAMDDDLNTADGLTAIFELVRDLNKMISDPETSKEQLVKGAELFDCLTGVLGILYNRNEKEEIPGEILELVQKRKEARKAKDFALADKIRDEITAMGYTVKETRQGTEITKSN